MPPSAAFIVATGEWPESPTSFPTCSDGWRRTYVRTAIDNVILLEPIRKPLEAGLACSQMLAISCAESDYSNVDSIFGRDTPSP